MTNDELVWFLSWIAKVNPSVRTYLEDGGTPLRKAWLAVLSPVPLEIAKETVQRFVSTEWPMHSAIPRDIRAAWYEQKIGDVRESDYRDASRCIHCRDTGRRQVLAYWNDKWRIGLLFCDCDTGEKKADSQRGTVVRFSVVEKSVIPIGYAISTVTCEPVISALLRSDLPHTTECAEEYTRQMDQKREMLDENHQGQGT